MAGLVESFGRYVDRQTESRPAFARWLLLNAYRAYGQKMRWFPNHALPDSRNFLGQVCMQSMVQPLAHPERQVLVSLFMPCEPFYAMGLFPMCAEQYSTYANGAGAEHGFIEAAEHAGIAETFCSYHKVLTGAALSQVMPKPLAIVNCSLACDANNLTFRKISEIMDVPQFYVDVPYTCDADSIDYVAWQLREMTGWFADCADVQMDPGRLEDSCRNARETIRTLRRCLALRRDHYLPTELTVELYEALMTHNALGKPETLDFARRLERDFANSRDLPGRKILWMHTNPFYQEEVRDLFNYRQNPWIALTEMCYDSLSDGLEDIEDPYLFMASRLVLNSYNGPISRRAERAVQMARTVGADGVILFCHWGCKETCGASPLIRDALEAEGFPVLVLNGDGVDRRNSSGGQVRTRIEAFLEMLEARK